MSRVRERVDIIPSDIFSIANLISQQSILHIRIILLCLNFELGADLQYLPTSSFQIVALLNNLETHSVFT